MGEFKDVALFVMGVLVSALGWLWKRAVGKIDGLESRVALIEKQDLMDAKGVWAVFNQQTQALEKVEQTIRRDMTQQHAQLRAEVNGRMDDIESDLRQVNNNVVTLITRQPTQRADDQ